MMQGLVQPITGIDHVLAMVAVGVLAAQFGGRALWLIPLTFVVVMAVGGAMGLAAIHLPFPELGITLSIVVLGLAIAFPFRLRRLQRRLLSTSSRCSTAMCTGPKCLL
jgi:urease accessory protein